MADQVRAFTNAAIADHVDEVYRRLDEAGPMSNRRRKELLRDELGPAFTTVYNPRTGKYYTAGNDPDGLAPSRLDPRLEERIKNMPPEIRDAVMEHQTPGGDAGLGSHSEVYALNEALLDDPSINIEDLLVDTRRTGLDDNYHVGDDFPACPHCQYIISGATILSG